MPVPTPSTDVPVHYDRNHKPGYQSHRARTTFLHAEVFLDGFTGPEPRWSLRLMRVNSAFRPHRHHLVALDSMAELKELGRTMSRPLADFVRRELPGLLGAVSEISNHQRLAITSALWGRPKC